MPDRAFLPQPASVTVTIDKVQIDGGRGSRNREVLGVPSSTRATLRAWLLWAMGLLLATYAAGLVLHGVALGPVAHHWVVLVVDNWLGLAVEWVPAAVCWVAFSRVGARRPELLLAALAVTSYALGDTYWAAMAAVDTSVPFPSL